MKPNPFSIANASVTETPFCVMLPAGDYPDNYFGSFIAAANFQKRNGGKIFRVDRETGEWNETAGLGTDGHR